MLVWRTHKTLSYAPMSILISFYLVTALSSCSRDQRVAPIKHAEVKPWYDYSMLLNGSPPIEIDTKEPMPFSRVGVPWNDNDIVGLEIIWLTRPNNYISLPRFALVINEYTKCLSMLCLVTENGSVVGSTTDLGLIQRIKIVSIAPTNNPQLLVYSNSDYGPGVQVGEIVLIEFSDGAFRTLLRAPRYQRVILEGCELKVAIPLLVRYNRLSPCISLPITRIRFPEVLPDNSTLAPDLDWTYQEYEWDAQERQFKPVRTPQVVDLLTDDAWYWSPYYDPRERKICHD